MPLVGMMGGFSHDLMRVTVGADAVGVLVVPVCCGLMWGGKKVVQLSRHIDAEKHPIGRTCLKVAGYALMGVGFGLGMSGGLLLTAASTLTFGVIGGMYGGAGGGAIGACAGAILGLVSIYTISKVFHKLLMELKAEEKHLAEGILS